MHKKCRKHSVFYRLVRMRSAVQIRPSAPEHRLCEVSRRGGFLFSANTHLQCPFCKIGWRSWENYAIMLSEYCSVEKMVMLCRNTFSALSSNVNGDSVIWRLMRCRYAARCFCCGSFPGESAACCRHCRNALAAASVLYSELSSLRDVRSHIDTSGNAQERLHYFCRHLMLPEDTAELLKFVDLSTSEERMGSTRMISHQYRRTLLSAEDGVSPSWRECSFIEGDRNKKRQAAACHFHRQIHSGNQAPGAGSAKEAAGNQRGAHRPAVGGSAAHRHHRRPEPVSYTHLRAHET